MKVKEIKKILKLRQRKLPKLSLKLGYFIRPLIILFTSGLIAGIYYFGKEVPNLKEGDIALRDIYAPFDFQYKLGLDEEKTRELREKARRQAGEIYHFKKDVQNEILQKIDKIFVFLSSKESNEFSSLPEELMPFIPQGMSFDKLMELRKYDKQKVISEVSLLLKEFYKNNYVILVSDLERILDSDAPYIYIKRDGELSQIPPKSFRIITLTENQKIITSELKKKFKLKDDVLLNVIAWNLMPNIIISGPETETLKKQAASKIENVYIYKQVKKYEKILSKGERIKKDDLIKLREISQRYGSRKFLATSGIFFFSLIFLALVTISFKYLNLKFYKDVTNLILVCLIVTIVVGLTKVIVISPLPSQLTPVTMAPISVAILFSFPIALEVAILVAVITAGIIGDNVVPLLCFLIGGITAALVAKDARKRSHLLKAGTLIGGVQFFVVLALGFIFGIDLDVSLKEGVNSLSGGILSAFFALGLLPILEHTFKLTTNIHLLELSDLNHTLLKELLIKAPGTYHHSLIVSSLAEQAAEAVGANPLLTRVGAYFHDIGKLEKPEYFSENQTQDRKERSRHDKLSPSMSSLIIINHVKKGIELAQKYKLPPAIVDFIEQHHGQSLVYYFYHKALEAKSEQEIEEEQFRYPGPKPQTKEVGIVSLADAVEAATRSLPESAPGRIKGLIRDIINNKFTTGELDECELTLKDLTKIADIFTRLSVSVHHVRVEYPAEEKQT